MFSAARFSNIATWAIPELSPNSESIRLAYESKASFCKSVIANNWSSVIAGNLPEMVSNTPG